MRSIQFSLNCKPSAFAGGFYFKPSMNDSLFQKTTLPNGLRILTERHPAVHSATIGIWIQAGSIYEQENEHGLAHLLEHMVFKGTKHRSMMQIAKLMDSIGGQMNAFTDREFVCYHAKVLSEHTPDALQLLCDITTEPLLEASDLEIEKGVIIEEIRSTEDVPEELVEDLFVETIWPRSRWGGAIAGSEASVSALQADDLRRFINRHYTPNNIVVAAVGDVDHDDIVRRASKALKNLPQSVDNAAHRQPPQPAISAHKVLRARDVEQIHLVCGTRGYAYDDRRRFAAFTLDTILTAGYSSRLFQEVREKRGLCYNISSLAATYQRGGFWAVETSVAPESASETAKIIGRELRKVKRKGVTAAELKRANQMTRANLLLAEESSSAQMSRIARNELYHGRQKSTQEVLDEVLSVSLDEIQAVANEMFDPALMNLAAVGPFEDEAATLHVDVE
jgi:predicted Zn-dependent peptidase